MRSRVLQVIILFASASEETIPQRGCTALEVLAKRGRKTLALAYRPYSPPNHRPDCLGSASGVFPVHFSSARAKTEEGGNPSARGVAPEFPRGGRSGTG